MAKATTTIRQALNHQPQYAAWFAATQALCKIHEQGWLPMDQIFLPNYASQWSSGDAARTLEADYGGVSEAAQFLRQIILPQMCQTQDATSAGCLAAEWTRA